MNMDMSTVTMLLSLGIGMMVVAFLLLIVWYVLFSMAHMKALKQLGYANAWLAWIPYGVFYACGDSVLGDEDQVEVFNGVMAPALLFKIWWLIPLALSLIPFLAGLRVIINVVISAAFLGGVYGRMYARLDGKSEDDTRVLGWISGVIQIIPLVKFLTLK